MTYRYTNLFFTNLDTPDFRVINSLDELMFYEKHDCYIHYFIRTEHLAEELIHVLKSCGTALTSEEKNLVISSTPQNTSSRVQNAGYYYDKETRDLVYRRERPIIDKFNYAPPEVS